MVDRPYILCGFVWVGVGAVEVSVGRIIYMGLGESFARINRPIN